VHRLAGMPQHNQVPCRASSCTADIACKVAKEAIPVGGGAVHQLSLVPVCSYLQAVMHQRRHAHCLHWVLVPWLLVVLPHLSDQAPSLPGLQTGPICGSSHCHCAPDHQTLSLADPWHLYPVLLLCPSHLLQQPWGLCHCLSYCLLSLCRRLPSCCQLWCLRLALRG
jgi:hypothetical protein